MSIRQHLQSDPESRAVPVIAPVHRATQDCNCGIQFCSRTKSEDVTLERRQFELSAERLQRLVRSAWGWSSRGGRDISSADSLLQQFANPGDGGEKRTAFAVNHGLSEIGSGRHGIPTLGAE